MLIKEHPLSKFNYCPKCGFNEFVVHDFKSKHCNSCGFTYYFNPSAATVAVIMNGDCEILVATRSVDPGKGLYDLPGGFVDYGETAEEAIVREVYEETSLSVSSLKYLFSEPNLYVFSDFEVQTTDLFFLCYVDDMSVFKAHDDVAALEFIPLASLKTELFALESIKKGILKLQQLDLASEVKCGGIS